MFLKQVKLEKHAKVQKKCVKYKVKSEKSMLSIIQAVGNTDFSLWAFHLIFSISTDTPTIRLMPSVRGLLK